MPETAADRGALEQVVGEGLVACFGEEVVGTAPASTKRGPRLLDERCPQEVHGAVDVTQVGHQRQAQQ